MLITRVARAVALAFLVLVVTTASKATAKPSSTAQPAAASAPATGDPAAAPAVPEGPRWTPGPTRVDLGHEIDMDLPAGYVFLGMPEAGHLLEKLGTFHNQNLLGLVTAGQGDSEWFLTIRYEEEGFIKDDEKIDADELLKAIREGTEEANKEREERGFPALHVGAWAEPPRYEKSLHHLVWALTATSDNGTSVNFNTRVLGRKGYVALNLVTEPAQLEADKPHAAALLAATHFRAGARYEDFDAKKDKVAEYGLIGLVLGGAGLGALKLAKVGLLAKFSKVILGVLVAGKKAIVALFAGAAALVRKVFSRNKSEQK